MPRKPRSKPAAAPGLPTHRAILAPVAPGQSVRVRARRPLFLATRVVQPGEKITLTPEELREWAGAVEVLD